MRRRGYLLLEVVLALSIFMVAVVGLMRTLSAALDADFEQRRQTDIRITVENMLAEAKARKPKAGVETTEPDAFRIRYRREVAPTEIQLENGTRLNGLFRVTVQAMDTARDDRVLSELWTYVAP